MNLLISHKYSILMTVNARYNVSESRQILQQVLAKYIRNIFSVFR